MVLPSLLEELTSDDVRVLVELEDEWDRRGRFARIFPAPGTGRYLKYFDIPKYGNLLLDEWTSQYYYMRESGIIIFYSIPFSSSLKFDCRMSSTGISLQE